VPAERLLNASICRHVAQGVIRFARQEALIAELDRDPSNVYSMNGFLHVRGHTLFFARFRRLIDGGESARSALLGGSVATAKRGEQAWPD
jgi:hypothetical protein